MSPMRKQAYKSYRSMFSVMERLGTLVCKGQNDFALFSRLFLSELKCCNCVQCWVFLVHQQKVFFVYLF